MNFIERILTDSPKNYDTIHMRGRVHSQWERRGHKERLVEKRRNANLLETLEILESMKAPTTIQKLSAEADIGITTTRRHILRFIDCGLVEECATRQNGQKLYQALEVSKETRDHYAEEFLTEYAKLVRASMGNRDLVEEFLLKNYPEFATIKEMSSALSISGQSIINHLRFMNEEGKTESILLSARSKQRGYRLFKGD